MLANVDSLWRSRASIWTKTKRKQLIQSWMLQFDPTSLLTVHYFRAKRSPTSDFSSGIQIVSECWLIMKLSSIHLERNATPPHDFQIRSPTTYFRNENSCLFKTTQAAWKRSFKTMWWIWTFRTVLEPSKRRKLRCYWKTGAFKTRPNPLQCFVHALRIRHFWTPGILVNTQLFVHALGIWHFVKTESIRNKRLSILRYGAKI